MAKGTQLKDILWYIAIAVAAFPLVPLFDHFDKPELERPAYFALMVILITIKVCRDLRTRLWYWIATVAIAVLHVPLIMVTARRLYETPFPVMLAICIADDAVILAVIRLLERLIDGPGVRTPADS